MKVGRDSGVRAAKRGLPPIPAFGIGWLYPVCPKPLRVDLVVPKIHSESKERERAAPLLADPRRPLDSRGAEEARRKSRKEHLLEGQPLRSGLVEEALPDGGARGRGRSQHRLQVRAYDSVYAVDPGESRERLKIRFTCPFAVGPESFDGDVQPNLVPVLEAVGNRLFGRVHSHGNLVNHDDLDSGAEGRLRIPEDAQWNTVDSWHLSMTGQRKVDSLRDLRGQPMMGQGRDQAENATRNPNCDRNKVQASQRRRSGDAVEPASRMFSPLSRSAYSVLG